MIGIGLRRRQFLEHPARDGDDVGGFRLDVGAEAPGHVRAERQRKQQDRADGREHEEEEERATPETKCVGPARASGRNYRRMEVRKKPGARH